MSGDYSRPAMMIVARYHEIALKGGNRPFFVEALARNLRRATADLGGKVQSLHGRLALTVPDTVGWDTARERMERAFGVANFNRTYAVGLDFDALRQAVLSSLAGRSFASFRVTTRRSNKRFPLDSGEIDRQLGAAILQETGVRVDLHHPALTVFV